MAIVFLDTSALIRRYDASEPDADRVRQLCAPASGHTILLARLASLEMASALNRKTRDGTLRPAERDGIWQLFQTHWRDQYQVVILTEQAYARAEQLLFQYSLRTLDALHVGCALVVAGQIPQARVQFWTADRQQARAASGEGLVVDLLG